MSAVERISNYLNARAKIRQFDQAYIHWINECADSEAVLQTSDIVELLQQRAELLDALNAVIDHGDLTGADWVKDKVYDAVNGSSQ